MSAKLTIKQWDKKDRPREKLLELGASALSDAELLAILIGSGTKNMSAVDLAKKILADNNFNLNQLAKKSINELTQYDGIGMAKAITIAAALELSKRRIYEQDDDKIKITSSKDAFKVLCPYLCDLTYEVFYLLTLNNKNEVIFIHKIAQGGINSMNLDLKVLFKKIILDNATGFIVSHNHPSGQLTYSQEDMNITENIKKLSELFNLRFLDHLIIVQNNYFSFADKGLL